MEDVMVLKKERNYQKFNLEDQGWEPLTERLSIKDNTNSIFLMENETMDIVIIMHSEFKSLICILKRLNRKK
jgi:hypothetical protein